MKAYCGMCKKVYPAWWEESYRQGEWKDEGQPVWLQVHEAVRSDVEYLNGKSGVQWKKV